jgi:hypothetical protein
VLIVTIPFRNSIPGIAIAGMTAAAVLEYATGAVMERLFHVRYWDYTGKFLNLNGYICFASVACWSVMSVLVVEVVQVRIEHLVLSVNERYVTGIVLLMTPFLTADFVTSFHAAIRLRDILQQNEKMKEELEKMTAKRRELENALEMMAQAGGYAKETMAQAGEYAKETAMQAGERAKETVVQAGGYVIETAMQAGERAKETMAQVGGLAKETAMQAGERAKETMVQVSERAKENALPSGHIKETKPQADEAEKDAGAYAAARAKTAEELKALLIRMGELRGRMHVPYGKSIRGLLRRNPTAVSRFHRESFAELKQTLTNRIEENKKTR